MHCAGTISGDGDVSALQQLLALGPGYNMGGLLNGQRAMGPQARPLRLREKFHRNIPFHPSHVRSWIPAVLAVPVENLSCRFWNGPEVNVDVGCA